MFFIQVIFTLLPLLLLALFAFFTYLQATPQFAEWDLCSSPIYIKWWQKSDPAMSRRWINSGTALSPHQPHGFLEYLHWFWGFTGGAQLPGCPESPAGCLHACSCPTLLWPLDCSPTRLLYPWDFPGKNGKEWVAISFSRGSPHPRDWTHVTYVSCIDRWVLYHWGPWEARAFQNSLVPELSQYTYQSSEPFLQTPDWDQWRVRLVQSDISIHSIM